MSNLIKLAAAWTFEDAIYGLMVDVSGWNLFVLLIVFLLHSLIFLHRNRSKWSWVENRFKQHCCIYESFFFL